MEEMVKEVVKEVVEEMVEEMAEEMVTNASRVPSELQQTAERAAPVTHCADAPAPQS